MKTETILGLTTLEPYGLGMHSHDSSACISDKTKIVGAVSEERFTRNKHHAGFPWMSLNYLLRLGYSYSDIDAVAIPWPLKQAVPKHLELAKRFYYGMIPGRTRYYEKQPLLYIEKKKIIGIGHQRAHAASAYRTSGFNKALVISLDLGGSEEDTVDPSGGIFTGENGELTRIRSLKAGFGLFYSFVTEGLGFRALEGEAQTSGLASYGNPNSKAYDKLKSYAPTVRGANLVGQRKTIKLGVTVINNYQRLDFRNLKPINYLIKRFSNKDVAAAAQRILEDGVVQLIDNALEETGKDKLCLAGGIFANAHLNKKIRALKRVKTLYIYPVPGHSGAAVGAALEAHHSLTGEKTVYKPENNVFLGPDYTDTEIEAILKKHRHLTYKKTSDPSGDAAELISRGKIVGWFQGRMEWGPNALGARSVLSAAHDIKIREKLNLRLKKREAFMPFASTMLFEDVRKYLKNPSESPYMNIAYDVQPHVKDQIAAIVHVDNTVNPQTLTKQQNPLYYDLIHEYEKMTGTAAVLNTSFNMHGLPIVCTPEDAVDHLFLKCVEDLVIGNFIVKIK